MINNEIEISAEGLRIIANTAQYYDALLDAMREKVSMPKWMAWGGNSGKEYLYEMRAGQRVKKCIGVRSTVTESTYQAFQGRSELLAQRIEATSKSLATCLAQYKVLHLPQVMPLPARILRTLDLSGDLGTNLMVVGTNAFPAYEIEARERFAKGLDETEDFDLGWCRGSKIAFNKVMSPAKGSPLFSAIKQVDKTFEINRKKPYQALNSAGYEVELLTAPSVMPTLSRDEVFSTAAIPEQEWLLLGRPIRHVLCARDGSPAPLYVPDPRYMGLHKLWLSAKETRRADKKDKDARQGELLLSAVARKMQTAYPMNLDFVLELPEVLLPVFNQWAARNNFTPTKAANWWPESRAD